ncbi:Histidine--tRNA ligase [Paraliobacillus sp. PM-2]|uniref:His/Gly/Thr/Pro-type tRNA ligase C-terminal domain-containing protein n=1 Tax=Paraliobacillus sp. PM-2 TaxID=1462524 RepID=UPI00061C8085|nr:His/Gly/Thr/Pro-type tRNA ligase C-terminal domain-containing protein [Paraliobacillus sp. PM-2]CQR48462.1 Histidine--tRNA ligase [Paraliobacillus sp. PM-2]
MLVANDLRQKGYKVEYEMSNKKLGKALEKANKANIRNVIIIGEDEIKNKQLKIKDMYSGDEKIEPYLFARV